MLAPRVPAHLRGGHRPRPLRASAARPLVWFGRSPRSARAVVSRNGARAPDDDDRGVAGHDADRRLALRSRHAARGAALDHGDPARKCGAGARLLHRRTQHGHLIPGDALRVALRGGSRSPDCPRGMGRFGKRTASAGVSGPLPLVCGGGGRRRLVVPGRSCPLPGARPRRSSPAVGSAARGSCRPRPLAAPATDPCHHDARRRRWIGLSRRGRRDERDRGCRIDLDDHRGPHDSPPRAGGGAGAQARRDRRDASRSRPLLSGRRHSPWAAGRRTARRRALSRRRVGRAGRTRGLTSRDGGGTGRSDSYRVAGRGAEIRSRYLAVAASAAWLRCEARQRHLAGHPARGGERIRKVPGPLPRRHRGVRGCCACPFACPR